MPNTNLTHLREDIRNAMEDLRGDVINYSELSEIESAPAIMREELERVIKTIETQVADWKRRGEV